MPSPLHPDEMRGALPDGADVVICGPGTDAAMQAAIEAVAPGGTVVMFTPFPPEVPVTIDSQRMYFGDLRIVASYSCGPDDTRAALDLVARGIVTRGEGRRELVPLDEVPRAYRELARVADRQADRRLRLERRLRRLRRRRLWKRQHDVVGARSDAPREEERDDIEQRGEQPRRADQSERSPRTGELREGEREERRPDQHRDAAHRTERALQLALFAGPTRRVISACDDA